MARNVTVSTISTGGFQVEGKVNGTATSFLLDTGAAATLLRKDTWERVSKDSRELLPCPEQRLVSVDGTPLKVHGQSKVTLNLAGETFTTNVIVVSPLTSPAILGLDFLRKHNATINLHRQLLTFDRMDEQSIHVPLQDPARVPEVYSVRAREPLHIPPCSEIMVMGVTTSTESSPRNQQWIVESNWGQRSPVIAARALVKPQVDGVPVRLLNPREETVTVRAGAEIATLEPVEIPQVSAVGAASSTPLTAEKERMLLRLVEEHGDELSEDEREQFFMLLTEYADVFAFSESDLGRTSKLKHQIYTGNAPPVRQAVRRVPPQRRQQVHELLNRMLKDDIIQPSSSPWAAPVVLVKKKNGSLRFCVDYRRLNEVTRKDAYPLPRIDDTIDTLAGSRFFSTLDLLSGYWQVEVAEDDRPKTAFCTTEGLFEFSVMPFGLCNAPATFQRLMDLVLRGLQWSQCLVYIDDVIIPGRSYAEHLTNLRAVLGRLQQAGLKLQPKKCSFLKQRVSYLGHVVSREGVATDPAKIEKVANWPVPTTAKDVQQFLGFAGYYRRFVKDFAQIARPLYHLTERKTAFRWTKECDSAFKELRHCLVTAPILTYPDFSRPFILDTDASDTGIGAVLSQQDHEGKERVIAYASRVLSKPERNYCVTRRELLAVVHFTKHFRPYLLGSKFTLRTDHGSLKWLKNFKEPEGQTARWLERLEEFDYEVVHRKGRKHTNADALSRQPCRQCGRDSHSDNPVQAVSLSIQDDNLRQLQLNDDLVGRFLKAKEANSKPNKQEIQGMSPHARRLAQIWDQLIIHNGLLYRRYEGVDDSSHHLQLLVPECKRKQVLEDLHEGVLGGHLGQEKTLGRLQERFYWPGYHNDVRDWINTCSNCAARKTQPPKNRSPLQNMKAGAPMQLVAADILGPFPESDGGNSYILVASDYFTRWVEAYAIPNQEAATVAKKLTDEFFFRFSPPEQLHTDQGRQFESELLAEVCKLLGIDKTRTTPYHPQSDGLVERNNRTLLSMLATAAEETVFNWEEHLRPLCMAYNTSVHPTTGFTPFYLMFGRQARMPIDVMFGTPTDEDSHKSPSQHAAELRKHLESAYRRVREQMGHQLERQKDYYDKKVHGKPYSEGDFVWLYSPVVPRGRARKLHRPWTGPFVVNKKLSDSTYRIQHAQCRRNRQVVHFDRLKPCPPDIRLREQLKKSVSPQDSESSVSPQPPGSRLTLIPHVDVPAPPPPPPPRYPTRDRRPPQTLYPMITH